MKSSSQTFIFRYLFPVLTLGAFLFGIYMMFSQETEEAIGFAKAFSVMVVWVSFFIIQMPIRLKSIEAKDKGVLVDKSTLIEYKDIIWLAKFDITAPYFITIKYRDRVSGTDKKIAYMPKQNTRFEMTGEDKLTAYIKNMVKESDSNITKEEAPSTWKNFALIFLLSIPFTLLAFYFINDSFGFF
jgi:heme/copper-type cytochrome/quinol oxidase subunit 4